MVELRDYQIRSIKKIQSAFKQGFKRVILRLDCGAGKTITSATMCIRAANKGNEVLFLVHRQELLQQTIDTFKALNANSEKIKIGMVITVGNHLENYNPTLIIADECNFSIAKTWRKVFDAYPNAYIVGLSATPCRLDNKGMGEVFETIISDITAKELISRGNLCNYEYYAPQVKIDLSSVKKRGGDYAPDQLENQLDKKAIYGDVIKHFKKLAPDKRTIIYCVTIKHSKNTCEEFVNSGFNCEHIDGTTPDAERKAIIERFRTGKTQILSNCNLISFGFDVPDCDCVIMLRPTQSLSIYIQSAMRCLRGKKGKTAIIIDHVGNVFRHDFPDIEREWSLDSKKRVKENTVSVKTCPECYRTHFPAPICPYCGYVYGSEEKTRYEIEILEKEELQRIEEVKKKQRQEVGRAESYEALLEIQISRNYKNGWAAKQAQIKGIPIKRYKEIYRN